MDEHFLREKHQAYPGVQDEHPVGLITLEQVRAVPSDQWAARHVGDVMAPAPDGLTVGPDAPMTEVLEKMDSSGTERVLVTRGDRLEGIITVADLTVWIRRAQEQQQSLGGSRRRFGGRRWSSHGGVDERGDPKDRGGFGDHGGPEDKGGSGPGGDRHAR
jgi:hypothetical protein